MTVQVGLRTDIRRVNISCHYYGQQESLIIFPTVSCGKVGQSHVAEKDVILIRTDTSNLQPPTTKTALDTHALRSHQIVVG